MKKINFFAMALAAMTMFSCSNEEEMNVAPAGEKANVTLTLKGAESIETRATVNSDTDNEIRNYLAFFFNAQGQLVTKHEVADPNAQDANKLSTTTAATEVYIVANVGALATSGFNDVVNKTQIAQVVKSLSTTSANTASTQTATNVWMEGIGNITFIGRDGAATVAMKFLAAKVKVTVVDNRSNNTAGGPIHIENNEIVLLNAGGNAKFFATDAEKMTQSSFFNGDISYPTPANNVAAAFLSENYAGTGVYFYAFGNSSDTQPTILAIKATRTENSTNASTVYYPIAFSTLDAGAVDADAADFAPGYTYDVTLTLTGDVSTGGGNGTVDPEEPLVSGTVTVTITKAQWTVKTIGKEFN